MAIGLLKQMNNRMKANSAFFVLLMVSTLANSATCSKPVYLTFDTGNMAVADYVANTLRQHDVKATFFLANEKTKRGDYSLDDSWIGFWQELKKEGHAFGNHTFHHTYFIKDLGQNRVLTKPQFGSQAGKALVTDQQQLCQELKLVNDRFVKITGKPLDPIWRAPGGKVSPQYIEMGHVCSYKHVGWSPAGFLGDELASEKFSNASLLDKALKNIQPGDVLMAHLGIWSRNDPWAPEVLEPLILGLKKKGYCFGTILDAQHDSRLSRIIQ
jgi:peptidoglycan/xylan/chitin deacetylase (PgdA/CDA1 family)